MKREGEAKTATNLTIKKHFVRFNLHFKQLKKIKMKNAIIMYEAFGSESIFMVLDFIYLWFGCFHKSWSFNDQIFRERRV